MEKLGIDVKLIAVQIVNFGLLLFILRKVLYKPVLETIRKRKEQIAAVAKEREELDKAKNKLQDDEREILAKAQSAKKELLNNTRREIEAERKKIIERANSEAKEIIQGTKRQVERDKKRG